MTVYIVRCWIGAGVRCFWTSIADVASGSDDAGFTSAMSIDTGKVGGGEETRPGSEEAAGGEASCCSDYGHWGERVSSRL